jgi:biopolymer transport protein ExbD
MNFRSGANDEPDINLIPFIDILLVVLIFLMLTTTFNRLRELQVSLPVADAKAPQDQPQQIRVAISADGRFAVDQRVLETPTVDSLVGALQQAAQNRPNPMVVILADAAATHQSVVNVMEAARRSGLAQITFSTQTAGQGGGDSGP